MDYLQYSYSGNIWRSCPTAGEADCFFHSVFGTTDWDDGVCRDKHAKFRRMNWSTFLTYYSCGGPTGALFDVLNRCFTANNQHRRIDNPDDYTNYANAVAGSGYWVLVEEISIIATLENVKIILFRDHFEEPMVFEPNLELLRDFPSRNINELKEVFVCVADGRFYRLNQVEEPIVKEATARQEPQETLRFNHKKDYPKLGNAGIHGSLYQINVLSMVLLNAMQKVTNWRLSTEHMEATQFDDLIFESLPSESAVLLQAKHKQDTRKKITRKDLMSVNKKNLEFSLPKYFFAYHYVKRTFQVQNVVICTNLMLDNKVKDILKQESVSPDSVLHFEGAENICYGFNGCSFPELKPNIETYHAKNIENNEVTISHENINDYLNHLKFFPNFLRGKKVENIIQQTISQVKFSENLSIKMIREHIRTKMTDWYKEEKGRYLTELEAKAFFCDIRSNKYCEDLKQYDIRFKRNNLPLILLQQNANDAAAKDPKRISHIIPDKEYMLNVVKIYQALPAHYKDKTLLVNPEEAFELQRQMLDAFEVQHYTTLVMVCPNNSIEETEVKEMCDKVMQVLNTHKYKHVILIAEEKNHLATQLKHSNINSYEVITDSITFADLDETTQGEFKRKKLINFQGNTISLEELFTSSSETDLIQILSSEMLIKIARSDITKVGQELPGVDNYYIRRSFNRNSQILSEEELWRSTEEKVILISDSAGMGKSYVLTSLGISIKSDNPHLWVMRMNLNNYISIMKTTLAQGRKSVSIIDLLNSQEASKLTNEFGKKLITTSNRVVLMLDGADEISPSYTELVVNLIRTSLGQVNLAKIFVTTRPHMSKDLEEILEMQSFTLKPFTKFNQIQFLIKYWTGTLNLQDGVETRKCKIFAKALIDNIPKWIKEKNRNNFAGIPLQTKMLAEIFIEKIEISDGEHDWEGCKEFLSSKNEEPKLPTKIDLTQLYELCVDKKCEIFIINSNPSGPPSTDKLLKDQFEKYSKFHRALAVKVIFDSDRWDHFTCYTKVEWPIPSTVKDVLFRVGIVQKQGEDENIEFLHRTFAEFFVADCLPIELEPKPINKEFQQFFMRSILLRKEYYVIRAFLNSRMQRVWHLIENNFCSYFQHNRISEELLTHYFHVCAKEGCARIMECLIKCIDKERREILSKAINKLHLMYDALSSAIIYGHFNILKLLLDLNEKFNKGKDAHKLFLASAIMDAVDNNFDAFKFLSHKVDESDENILGRSASELHEVAFVGRFGQVELWMEKAGADIKTKDNICGSLAQHGAISMSLLEVVKFVMEEIGGDINAKDKYGETVLHRAVYWGKLEIIKYLVKEAGADVNVKDTYGETALHIAAYLGKFKIVRCLVEGTGADINLRNNKDRTVLHSAALEGEFEIVKYLVENTGVDINAKDTDGETALHIAAYRGKLDIVKCLVDAGINIKVKDSKGDTELHSAGYAEELEIVKYLMKGAATDINVRDGHSETTHHNAGEELEIIKELVEKAEVDINAKDGEGGTVLHLTALRDRLEILKYLAEEAGADKNVKNSEGQTALHIAAYRGNLEIVKCLVEAGADINIKDNDGSTALYAATCGGNLEIVKYLVEQAGVYENVKSSEDFPALNLAAYRGKLEMVAYMVDVAGVDKNFKNNNGSTALHAAAYGGKLEIVKYLVEEAVVNKNIKNNQGKTAVHEAALSGNLEIVKYLVEIAGTDKNITNNEGDTALHEAAFMGKLEIVRYLVEIAGTDKYITNNEGATALHEAAFMGKLEIVRYLVEEAGVDKDVKNGEGETALHEAASMGKLEIVKYLVEEAEADKNVKNIRGKTAIQTAADKGHWEVVQFLSKVTESC